MIKTSKVNVSIGFFFLEHIGTEFILFILDIVEIPPEADVLEIIPDIMINLILSLNLQFEHFADNFILNAMQKISSAKTFTEKILVLLNREGKTELNKLVGLWNSFYILHFQRIH